MGEQLAESYDPLLAQEHVEMGLEVFKVETHFTGVSDSRVLELN